jgi:hypothetical protein
MLTNQDIDELLVMAEMEVNDDIEAALEEFYRPDVEREAAVLWAGLPEAVKRMVKERAPEAVKRIEEV